MAVAETESIKSVGGDGGKKSPVRPQTVPRAMRRFFSIVSETGRWAGSRVNRIEKFFLVPGSNGLRLYVIGKTDEYDFGLGMELDTFARELSDQTATIVLPTLLPRTSRDELTAFFNPGGPFVIEMPVV